MDTRKTPWVPEAMLFGAFIPAQPQTALEYRGQVRPGEWAKILGDFRLFSGVPKRRLRKLLAHARLIEYLPGESVIHQGDPGDSLYVVLSGSAQARGKPTARVLGLGDYFGELGLVAEAPRSATVVATSELQVMRIPREAFLGLARSHPAISLRVAGGLGLQIRRLEARLAQA